jgi:hypothetical protein
MNGIILEGVTGAGKSQTLVALQAHPSFGALLGRGRVFFEEETLGELMDELRDASIAPSQHCARLDRVLYELQQAAASAPHGYGYVLERFHPSYYALLPDWSLYASIDERLLALGCKIVLLYYDRAELEPRSLERVDRRDGDWAAGMVAYYGSRARAIDAIDLSQRRRRMSLELSRLPHQQIDTTAMDWQAYAGQIIDFWRSTS